MDIFSGLIEFVRIVELRSFVRAAESLALSKSAVSKAVARLEQRLGIRLLNRTTRSISLTEEGQFYYQYCRKILDDMQNNISQVMNMRTSPKGGLRVDCAVPLGKFFVIPRLPPFLERYPLLQLDIRLNDAIVDMAEGGIDVVIRLGKPKEPNLVARKVSDTRMLTVASSSYIERFGRPLHPKELENFNCIKYVSPRGKDEEWNYNEGGLKTKFNTGGNFRISHGEALLEAVEQGIGIAQLSDFIVNDALASGRVVEVLERFCVPGASIYIAYPQNKYLPEKARVFIDYMMEA